MIDQVIGDDRNRACRRRIAANPGSWTSTFDKGAKTWLIRIKSMNILSYLNVIALKNSSDLTRSPASISGIIPRLKRRSGLNKVENVIWNCCLKSEIAGMIS